MSFWVGYIHINIDGLHSSNYDLCAPIYSHMEIKWRCQIQHSVCDKLLNQQYSNETWSWPLLQFSFSICFHLKLFEKISVKQTLQRRLSYVNLLYESYITYEKPINKHTYLSKRNLFQQSTLKNFINMIIFKIFWSWLLRRGSPQQAPATLGMSRLWGGRTCVHQSLQ